MAGPVYRGLELYAGDDYPLLVHFRQADRTTGVDMTGHEPVAQIRRHAADGGEPLAAFDCQWDADDPATGDLHLVLLGSDTAALPTDTALRWDLATVDGLGMRRTWLAGQVLVRAGVSEPEDVGSGP